MGFNCFKTTATSRRQFTFYHSVPRNSWYSFYRPWKDERLSQPWSHPVARVAPDLLKALAILSDTTVRRSAVDRQDLKPYWKLAMINNPIIYKLFKYFTNHRKKTNRVVVFSSRPFPNILKYRDHR